MSALISHLIPPFDDLICPLMVWCHLGINIIWRLDVIKFKLRFEVGKRNTPSFSLVRFCNNSSFPHFSILIMTSTIALILIMGNCLSFYCEIHALTLNIRHSSGSIINIVATLMIIVLHVCKNLFCSSMSYFTDPRGSMYVYVIIRRTWKKVQLE